MLCKRNWVIDQMAGQGSVSREDERMRSRPKQHRRLSSCTANSEAAYDWNRRAFSLATHGSPANPEIRVRPGNKPAKQTPVISFDVLESREIRNAAVFRSSGVVDIDNYAQTSINTVRCNARPPGCGIIDSQATVNVDF